MPPKEKARANQTSFAKDNAATSSESSFEESIVSTRHYRRPSNIFPADDSLFIFNHEPHYLTVDFDDILPMIGEFGKSQIILFLCMIPFLFFLSFVYFAQIFMTLVPEKYWCKVPELNELPVNERLALSIPLIDGKYSKCDMYDVNYTDVLPKGIKTSDPEWPIVSCKHGWSYDFTDLPYETISTQQDWVCQDAALPTYAQSLFFVGAIIGGLLFGWIADRFGRIPALVGCNLFGFVAGVGTAFVNNFWQFTLMRFFVGFAYDNCFTMMYILVLEYIGPDYRTFVANMSFAIFFTMSSCLIPWMAYYIANWKHFAIATSAPLILAVLTPLIVPESARWLVSQGKFQKAIEILKKLEKQNGKHIPPKIYETFEETCKTISEEEHTSDNYSILDLFKTPRLRRITIIMILIWMGISIVFDGHVRSVGSLGLDVFVTFTIACATEFPADVFVTLTLDRWGRRWLAFGSMAASGMFSLIAAFVPIGIYSGTSAIIGRFFVNIGYNIGLQYAAEILPTVVRAQGVAFIHIMGYVATILAPFVVYLAYLSPALPMIILGIVGLVSGLLYLFIPETLHMDLPQTLLDGENFGRGEHLWEFPCARKRKKRHVTSIQTGARLRATSRGEIRSSMLKRSLRQRYSLFSK